MLRLSTATHPRLGRSSAKPLRRLACSAGTLAFLSLVPACERSPAAPAFATLEEAAATITPAGVGAHVDWLAADLRRGRWTPSPELQQSAAYVARVFRSAGLDAGGDDGSFLQRWPCEGVSGDDRPANVVAWRRGSDARLASEWVVVTAHYDAQGVHRPDIYGDSIFNGANDNASGTAALLEVARAFGRLASAPARSVAFVAVAGEELWLVGSWWFVEHPPAGMTDLVANVNLDMVGGNLPAQLYDFGEIWSSVGAAARATAEHHPELGLQLVGLANEDRGFERSDQFPFAWAGIPAVFLNGGTDPTYHTYSDEAPTINDEKVSRVARLTLYLAHELASRPERPAWNASWASARAGFEPIRGTCRGALAR